MLLYNVICNQTDIFILQNPFSLVGIKGNKNITFENSFKAMQCIYILRMLSKRIIYI